VTDSGLLGNSNNSSGHDEYSPVLHENQPLQQLQKSPAVASFTTQNPAPLQLQQAKLNSSVSLDSTETSAASSCRRVTTGKLGSAPSHAFMPPAPTGEAPLGPVALSKEQQVRGFFL